MHPRETLHTLVCNATGPESLARMELLPEIAPADAKMTDTQT